MNSTLCRLAGKDVSSLLCQERGLFILDNVGVRFRSWYVVPCAVREVHLYCVFVAALFTVVRFSSRPIVETSGISATCEKSPFLLSVVETN